MNPQFYYGGKWFDVRISVSSGTYALHFGSIEEANDFYDCYIKSSDRKYYLKNVYENNGGGEQYNKGIIPDTPESVTFKYWGNRIETRPNVTPRTKSQIKEDRKLYKQLNGRSLEVKVEDGIGGGFSNGKSWGSPNWREVKSEILQFIRNENLNNLLD